MLRRLAVFAGGFGAGGGAARLRRRHRRRDDVLAALGRLVDKSLVVAEERDGEARYRLLETIRAVRRRPAGRGRRGRGDRAIATSPGSWPSPRPANPSASATPTAGGAASSSSTTTSARPWTGGWRRPTRSAVAAWRPRWRGSGISTGTAARASATCGGRSSARRTTGPPLQARLLTGIALVADTASPLGLEYDAAQRALAIATEQGDERLRALCLTLSAVGRFYTDFDAAWTLAVDGLRAAEAAADPFVADAARALQAIILHLRDRHPEAEPLLESAAGGLLRRHPGIAATTLAFQASGALYTGRVDLARHLADRAVSVAEPLGDYLRVGSTRSTLAIVHGLAGDVDGGLRLMRPVVRLVEDAGTDVFVPGMARAMGLLHLWRDDPEAAASWFGREARSTNHGTETWLVAQSLPGLGAALISLGRLDQARDVLDRVVAVARRLDMPRVLADALEQQGHLAAADDDLDRAIDLHHQALAVRVEHGCAPSPSTASRRWPRSPLAPSRRPRPSAPSPPATRRAPPWPTRATPPADGPTRPRSRACGPPWATARSGGRGPTARA